ncbi:DUF4177 domain-containing protein [Pseudonocardia sp. KRD291]|uniref:DUF4177 domain-containing protein n=1 Tax=Pseudonocardia sp. KRD291 TaxID=2792007 RepID=UPI001C4A169D|nr:DUF4177 domain-containing protein [Pseudonocardia sp. KRD291]MBW0101191.1 DUF4177 domain-containing protein [Pseudonocardia sp. KRD291]
MAATFEHKVLNYALGWKGFDYSKIESELNDLGGQGWEVVGTVQPSVGAAPTDIVVFLKRASG